MKKKELKNILKRFCEECTYYHDDHLCINGWNTEETIDDFIKKLKEGGELKHGKT